MSTIRKGLQGRQPYLATGPGELHLTTLQKQLPIIGQDNYSTVARWNMEHGRALSGYGDNGSTSGGVVTHETKYPDHTLSQLECDDDVEGSGIFDPHGSTGTVHRNLGVFADDPSIPGYIAREVQFQESPEVRSSSSDAAVVVVPGGGMSYLERDGKPAPYLKACKKKKSFGSLGKMVDGTVSGPGAMVPVPTERSFQLANQASIADVSMDRKRIPAPIPPSLRPVRKFPQPMQPMHLHSWPRPVFPAFGEDPPKPVGIGTYLFAGLLVGTAAALFVGTLSQDGRKRT